VEDEEGVHLQPDHWPPIEGNEPEAGPELRLPLQEGPAFGGCSGIEDGGPDDEDEVARRQGEVWIMLGAASATSKLCCSTPRSLIRCTRTPSSKAEYAMAKMASPYKVGRGQ
jgi:hypothetical protein